MIDDERTQQEAYERGYDIEELALRTQSGKRTLRELEEERDSLEHGNDIYVTFKGKVMHFFDKEEQKNLLV